MGLLLGSPVRRDQGELPPQAIFRVLAAGLTLAWHLELGSWDGP